MTDRLACDSCAGPSPVWHSYGSILLCTSCRDQRERGPWQTGWRTETGAWFCEVCGQHWASAVHQCEGTA